MPSTPPQMSGSEIHDVYAARPQLRNTHARVHPHTQAQAHTDLPTCVHPHRRTHRNVHTCVPTRAQLCPRTHGRERTRPGVPSSERSHPGGPPGGGGAGPPRWTVTPPSTRLPGSPAARGVPPPPSSESPHWHLQARGRRNLAQSGKDRETVHGAGTTRTPSAHDRRAWDACWLGSRARARLCLAGVFLKSSQDCVSLSHQGDRRQLEGLPRSPPGTVLGPH